MHFRQNLWYLRKYQNWFFSPSILHFQGKRIYRFLWNLDHKWKIWKAIFLKKAGGEIWKATFLEEEDFSSKRTLFDKNSKLVLKRQFFCTFQPENHIKFSKIKGKFERNEKFRNVCLSSWKKSFSQFFALSAQNKYRFFQIRRINGKLKMLYFPKN